MGCCVQTRSNDNVAASIVNSNNDFISEEKIPMGSLSNDEFFNKMKMQCKRGDNDLARKQEIWKNLDFFVLDNSLRETTVAQIQSHTLADKQKIFKEVKKCGFTDIIVAAFSSATRVDDQFVLWLKQRHSKDFDKFYSFSEVSVGIEFDENGNSLYRYNTGDTIDDLPDGMKKNKQYKLKNTVFEADFGNTDDVKWGETWTVDDMCKLIEKRIRWVKDNISKNGRNFLNMRDLSRVMKTDPQRMFEIIKYMAEMPKEYRLFGMIFEEPGGECMPEQVTSWCKSIRDTMNFYGWEDGLLLNHIHAKMGYKDVVTMDCLANGCNGIWAAVCEEGAAVGHCSSSVTILNLIRHGNTKVSDKYNCLYLREAAINVTKITTKKLPHPKQIVYGERATDLVFGEGVMAMGAGGFDLAKFFGMNIEHRITTLATPDMIVTRLEMLFGDDERFTQEIAIKMKAEMIKDLNLDIKSDYHSPYGIALLFQRVGGKPTKKMLIKLDQHKTNFQMHNNIRQEIYKEWSKYTIKNVDKNHGTGWTAVLASMKKKQHRNLLFLQTSAPLTLDTNTDRNMTNNGMRNKAKWEQEKVRLLTSKSSDLELQLRVEKDEKEKDEKETDISIDINDVSRFAMKEHVISNDFLTFDKFYHGFMQPYFGCYRCQVTKNALKVLDVNNTGTIEWHEFCTYIDGTLNQYHDLILGTHAKVSGIDEMAQLCLKLTFEKGIIPAMRDRVNENLNPFSNTHFHVIHPKNYASHTATMICLHGIAGFDQGTGNGTFWYNQFSLSNAHKLFPYIRFVIPTADKISITDDNDTLYTAWYDVSHKTIANKDKDKDEEKDKDKDTNGDDDNNDNDDNDNINMNQFGNIKGLQNSIEKIKTLIRQEMTTYKIESKRMMICGFNQGGVVALLSALSMYKEFAGVVCLNSNLLGNNKEEFNQNMHIHSNEFENDNYDYLRDMAIYWFDTPPRRFYKDLGNQHSKKCFDYLKKDCKLNAFYQKYDANPAVRKHAMQPSKIELQLAKIVKKHLPSLK